MIIHDKSLIITVSLDYLLGALGKQIDKQIHYT